MLLWITIHSLGSSADQGKCLFDELVEGVPIVTVRQFVGIRTFGVAASHRLPH
jgi:hypothetical protein